MNQIGSVFRHENWWLIRLNETDVQPARWVEFIELADALPEQAEAMEKEYREANP